jgi:hypothetical protein
MDSSVLKFCQCLNWNKKLVSLCSRLINELSEYKALHPQHDKQLVNHARTLLSHHPSIEALTEISTEELSTSQPTQWFFYSGFEKLTETERAYFCGSYKPDCYKMPGCIEVAAKEIARGRNCSVEAIHLTAFTPLPNS